MSNGTEQSKDETRVSIIAAVKSPLGFFTLVVLIVEGVFGILAGISEGHDRTYLIFGMLALIFLLVLIVAGCAIWRPEALRGQRPALRLDELQNLTRLKIRTDFLDNFQQPEGFRSEISTDFLFGFCYPKNWRFARFPQTTQYGFALDVDHAKESESGFARNVNVIVADISEQRTELADLYNAYADQELNITANANRVTAESFLWHGRKAFRQRLNWTDKAGNRLSADQIFVADRAAKNLFVITFTVPEDEYTASKPLFDDIASTFRFP